ncbi:uncharacterized protein [Amphiura filiformis]|uniref:uncharacterized protein n=1 Tax=Amphiura filiformis TaxID=82378 RepID=UPI003B22791B
MMRGCILWGCLSLLTFILLIGSARGINVGFNHFILNDGEMRTRSDVPMQNEQMILQEGAIVDITCRSKYPAVFGPAKGVGVKWTLAATDDQIGNYPVDPDVFPAERNLEKYNIQYVIEPWYEADAQRVISTIRYTARLEDHNKQLACAGVDLDSNVDPDVSSYTGTHLHLIIRPAPAPLAFKSTVVHKWRGGFVGRIDIPISDYYTSWKIVLTFRRQVFKLVGGQFQVANEPCLHIPDCGDDKWKKWVIYQTFANRVLNPGDRLNLIFVATVWKNIDLGLVADVDFYGYDQTFHVGPSSFSSSSDVHVE